MTEGCKSEVCGWYRLTHDVKRALVMYVIVKGYVSDR